MSERHMPDDDTTLEQLLRAGLPPTQDPLFRIAVLERLERQRFRRQVAAAVLSVVPNASMLVPSALRSRVRDWFPV